MCKGGKGMALLGREFRGNGGLSFPKRLGLASSVIPI